MQMARDFGVVLKQVPQQQRLLVHSLASPTGADALSIEDGLRWMLKPLVEKDAATGMLSLASYYHAALIQVRVRGVPLCTQQTPLSHLMPFQTAGCCSPAPLYASVHVLGGRCL